MNKQEQKELLKEIMEADSKDGLYETVTNNHSLTAVEWLLKELEEQKLIKLDKLSTILFNKNFATRYELIINQAKAMEKEQIENAYESGWVNGDLKKAPRFGSDYYNEKFNNE